MRNPAGQKRLVAIDLSNFGLDSPVGFVSIVYAGKSFGGCYEQVSCGSTLIPIAHPSASTKIFAGKVDSVDPSHLTLNINVDGRRTVVDGWLGNDDRVVLSAQHH